MEPLPPGRAGPALVGREPDVARVTPRLAEMSRNVAGGTLRLDHADAVAIEEKGVIDRTARGRPFGDGHRSSGLRARAGGVAKRATVDRPSGRPQGIVDEDPRRGLVELDRTGLRQGDLDQVVALARGLGGGGTLQVRQGALGLPEPGLGLGGVALPEPALLLALVRPGLGGEARGLGLPCGEPGLHGSVHARSQDLAQLIELGPE